MPALVAPTGNGPACSGRAQGATPGDWELVRALRSADPTAGERIEAILKPVLERAIRHVLRGRSAELEDLSQDAFERVIRSILSGRFSGRSRLATWAYSIARHVAMDWLKARSTEQRYADTHDAVSLDPRPLAARLERQLEARAELLRIQKILARMKHGNVRVLLLHDVYDYTPSEVAGMLGIGISAMESRLRRARQELARRCAKTILKRGCGSEHPTGR